jgi:alkanesulfonate monooxygenase SsuD/methylene tetrahydromethanopterin reductase-like flavin-dependent oxidoreductase (luciferase family)
MEFGVFDHVDASGASLQHQYDQRLRLVELYDQSGFYGYHMAEHHATTLGVAPSPSVYLAAVIQRTRNLRVGPLVYTLNMHHPLRLAEEVSMLDHLSGGRFLLGVGRGISPFEIEYMGGDPATAQPAYLEAYEVLMGALTRDELSFEGQFHRYTNVPIVVHPLQKPHPPIWYGIGNPESVAWCVSVPCNIVIQGPLTNVRAITDEYRRQWAASGAELERLPRMGVGRHVIVAPTDEEALAIGARAYRLWHDSFMFLWRRRGGQPREVARLPERFEELIERGLAIAGSPQTVRTGVAKQIEQGGINYLLCRFAFGDLSFDEVASSVDLFSREVMPEFAAATH